MGALTQEGLIPAPVPVLPRSAPASMISVIHITLISLDDTALVIPVLSDSNLLLLGLTPFGMGRHRPIEPLKYKGSPLMDRVHPFGT